MIELGGDNWKCVVEFHVCCACVFYSAGAVQYELWFIPDLPLLINMIDSSDLCEKKTCYAFHFQRVAVPLNSKKTQFV